MTSARFQFESVSWLLGKLNDQIHTLASGNVIMEFRYSENGVFLLKLIPNMTILIKIRILLGAKYVAMFICRFFSARVFHNRHHV